MTRRGSTLTKRIEGDDEVDYQYLKLECFFAIMVKQPG